MSTIHAVALLTTLLSHLTSADTILGNEDHPIFTPLHPTTATHGPVFLSMDLTNASDPYTGTDHHILANMTAADYVSGGAQDTAGYRRIRVSCVQGDDANCEAPVAEAMVQGDPSELPSVGAVKSVVVHGNSSAPAAAQMPWGTSGWTPTHYDGEPLRQGPFYWLVVDAEGYYNSSWAFDVQTCYWDREGRPGCGEDEGLSGGRIAGVVVGSVAAGLIVLGGAWWFVMKRLRGRRGGYEKKGGWVGGKEGVKAVG